ncbi:type II toxin-antitoxin system RelB/DinJ family antitoxin [Lactovum odontotermitis]
MTTQSMNFKIDSDLKKEFQKLAESMGLTSTAMLTMFVKRAVDDQAMPFLPENRKFNRETMEAFAETAEIERQIRAGEITEGYTNAHDMLKSILGEDYN